jgi:hypothetical protein
MFEGIGHTGFTGTAFWIDPAREHAVILLTSALHPDGKGSAKNVRRDVASAASLMGPNKAQSAPSSSNPMVLTGIDVLEREAFTSMNSAARRRCLACTIDCVNGSTNFAKRSGMPASTSASTCASSNIPSKRSEPRASMLNSFRPHPRERKSA